MSEKQIPEINCLMFLVEKKFHKAVTTSSDFTALSEDIENETKENVSVSTLKRMWGYVSMNPNPRESTLDVLSRYVGQKDFKNFCHYLKPSEASQSSFFTTDFVNARDLEPGAVLEIGWNPDRLVRLRHLDDLNFEVISSLNSKLREGTGSGVKLQQRKSAGHLANSARRRVYSILCCRPSGRPESSEGSLMDCLSDDEKITWCTFVKDF